MNILFYWFIFFLLYSNTALSYKFEEKVFCPKEIICSRNKSISSCKLPEGEKGLWNKPNSFFPVKKGRYHFEGVWSSYQAQIFDLSPQLPTNSNTAVCLYKTKNEDGTTSDSYYLLVGSNSSVDLVEAGPIESSQWVTIPPLAYCMTYDPELCPLMNVPSLKFIVDSALGLKISANGISISEYLNNNGSKILTMYEAWDACTDVGLCLLHLTIKNDDQDIDVGGIIVNMNNRMSIEDFFERPKTNFEIIINRDEPNSIKIRRILN